MNDQNLKPYKFYNNAFYEFLDSFRHCILIVFPFVKMFYDYYKYFIFILIILFWKDNQGKKGVFSQIQDYVK